MQVGTLLTPPPEVVVTGWPPFDRFLLYVVGLAATLTVIGGGDVLSHAAREFPPPRVRALRRTGFATHHRLSATGSAPDVSDDPARPVKYPVASPAIQEPATRRSCGALRST